MAFPILSVRDLTVELAIDGKWLPAVKRVSFDLASGEALGIVGETGCGKTLLGRALIHLPPEGARVSGSIVCDGTELSSASEKDWTRIRGGRIAMVFQEPGAALDPVQTIGSQILESVRRHRAVSGGEARRIAAELLAEVSFPDPERGLTEYPHRLSGGLKQRALLAAALAGDPAVLIADEPTTALDATVSADVLELLDRLRRDRGLALILITHDLASVARHTDRTLVLYAGSVVEERPTGDLFGAPMHPYTRGLLDCLPRIGAERAVRWRVIAGAVPDLAFRPEGACAFAPRCPDRFEPCDLSAPPLFPLAAGAARCFLYEAPLPPREPENFS
ncbi:MAG TPA: ABC transporter ATP-binding protein [Thermoanaerobaculia bacterium]|jgi:oligopeptide/dipeptide ABC transporter ATP-binding protein|nr:ABC transporter ATP-binding protein [Thermoanaerobaculia bacterium]